MIYFKNENGEVFAYDTPEDAQQFAPAGLTEMTEQEVRTHLQDQTRMTHEQVEVLRLRAYADPLTGSDRYFAEASRMEAMGEEGWESVRNRGVVRYQEIQAEYPWND